jgi:cellulose synthase (UDP-forming)
MFFSDYPWVMVVAIIFSCILLAIIVRAMLRRRARARLRGNS